MGVPSPPLVAESRRVAARSAACIKAAGNDVPRLRSREAEPANSRCTLLRDGRNPLQHTFLSRLDHSGMERFGHAVQQIFHRRQRRTCWRNC